MDRADRLIFNRGSRRILLFWVISLCITAAAAWFLADFLAGRLISAQIRAMLNLAGGGSFQRAPDAAAIQAGEAIYSAYGITADTPPTLMADFAPTRRMLFLAIGGAFWVIVTIWMLVSCRQTDRIYSVLDEMSAECLKLAEKPDGEFPLHGNDAGSIRRLCDSIRQLAGHTAHAADLLRRDKRRMTDYLVDITHQMKNSLAVIRLNRDMLDELPLPENERERLSEEITQHLDSTETLVLEALKLAKLDADAVTYHFTDSDLAATCRLACSRSAPLFRQKGITAEVVTEGDPPQLPHDSFWFCEALENLLKNAADHAECTAVTVALEALPGAVRLTVSDNGRGIPAARLHGIFDRFRSGADCRSASTGIGMAIAKRIFGAHGGQLTVYSAEGQGTQFLALFLLPKN